MMLAQLPIVLVANSQSPYKSVQELVADAKKRPGEISFASTSTNGSGHLAGELLKLRAGIDMLHIPYRGSAAALPDVIAGRVPVMFDALVTAEPHIKAGKLRPLAVSTLTRAPAFPDVPTMVEAGYKDYYVAAWLGFLVPAKTPDAAADKLNKAVAQVLQDKEVIVTLTKQGWEIMPYGPSRQDFAKFLQAEKIKWDGVIKAAKLKAQ
jgi:tripartite-type tricarboxylate transporter receptor subunit TctC